MAYTINNRNDCTIVWSVLYYDLTNSALAMITNYDPRLIIHDHKVHYKLKAYLTIIIYDQIMIVKLLWHRPLVNPDQYVARI